MTGWLDNRALWCECRSQCVCVCVCVFVFSLMLVLLRLIHQFILFWRKCDYWMETSLALWLDDVCGCQGVAMWLQMVCLVTSVLLMCCVWFPLSKVLLWLLICYVWLPGCCYVVTIVFWVVARVLLCGCICCVWFSGCCCGC